MVRVNIRQRKTRVAYWRKVRGLKQEDLARWLGVTRFTIGNWEQGHTTPTRHQAEALAQILGVTVRQLFPFELF